MKRSIFFTIVSIIAMAIGVFALGFPKILLESKGVVDNPAANVWMSEVGMLLLAIGTIVFMIRNEAASLTLRAILIGIIMIQSGLFIIEILAYLNNIITEISDIVPNCALHLVLIGGLGHYLILVNKEIKQQTI